MEQDEAYDIAIIGGGINGTGIAADASLRGLRTLLCDQGDLASATSSASSKLIHGGLRYLEQLEFRLVKESLEEREILLTTAKHLVKPINFILPYDPQLRSRFLIRIGLFLYNHLARRSTLPHTDSIKLGFHPAGRILTKDYQLAFQYWDCKTDDTRLVIANALQAKAAGANIYNYTQCMKTQRSQNHWQLHLKDTHSGREVIKRSKVLINATGPWSQGFIKDTLNIKSNHELALVKGSHIVVPKLYQEEFAFLLQNKDNRIIFILPYLCKFSLIGTTDVLLSSLPQPITISEQEIDYLVQVVNQHFTTKISKKNIVHSFSGVRPLLKNKVHEPSAITRDYTIEMDTADAPLISIFGGKLTTYRKLSEKVIDKLQSIFREMGPCLTAQTPLPGSHYGEEKSLYNEIKSQYPWLEERILTRFLQQYGNNSVMLLDSCKETKDLGEHFGAGLFQREVDYLIATEWARTAEDILWRRTKLGYFFNAANKKKLQSYLEQHINKERSLSNFR